MYLFKKTEKLCKLKADVRNQGNTEVRQIGKEQWTAKQEFLEQQKNKANTIF